jgi:hypothetical protein
MPIFDATITLEAPRVVVLETVKDSLAEDDHLIVLREAPMLIVLRGDLGYVYVVGSKDGESSKLRLIVDKAARVRDAFRAYAPRDALNLLANSPRIIEEQAHDEAAFRLQTLCRHLGGIIADTDLEADDLSAPGDTALIDSLRGLFKLGSKRTGR